MDQTEEDIEVEGYEHRASVRTWVHAFILKHLELFIISVLDRVIEEGIQWVSGQDLERYKVDEAGYEQICIGREKTHVERHVNCQLEEIDQAPELM